MNKQLKMAMIEKGIKNFDLARHLNVDPAKISKILNGWVNPADDLKEKIAGFLGVPKESLWGKDGI